MFRSRSLFYSGLGYGINDKPQITVDYEPTTEAAGKIQFSSLTHLQTQLFWNNTMTKH
jgi:hypothetical protein